MHLKCKMTQAHVDRGVTKDCGKCPGALCVQEAAIGTEFEGYDLIVSAFFIYFYFAASGVFAASCTTPLVLRDFIYAFDDGKTPAPCEPFDLYPVMSKKAA